LALPVGEEHPPKNPAETALSQIGGHSGDLLQLDLVAGFSELLQTDYGFSADDVARILEALQRARVEMHY